MKISRQCSIGAQRARDRRRAGGPRRRGSSRLWPTRSGVRIVAILCEGDQARPARSPSGSPAKQAHRLAAAAQSCACGASWRLVPQCGLLHYRLAEPELPIAEAGALRGGFAASDSGVRRGATDERIDPERVLIKDRAAAGRGSLPRARGLASKWWGLDGDDVPRPRDRRGVRRGANLLRSSASGSAACWPT